MTRNPTLKYLPKYTENLGLSKNIYANICNSFIHIPKLETTQKCFSGWLDKQLWYIFMIEYHH